MCTGVEAQTRFAYHQRVAVEPSVLCCIGYKQEAHLQDRLGTERAFKWRFADTKTDLGFEELPAIADQGHDRNRRIAECGRQHRRFVESCLTRGVQDRRAVRLEIVTG
jgi:hypothetical protein